RMRAAVLPGEGMSGDRTDGELVAVAGDGDPGEALVAVDGQGVAVEVGVLGGVHGGAPQRVRPTQTATAVSGNRTAARRRIARACAAQTRQRGGQGVIRGSPSIGSGGCTACTGSGSR